MEIGIQDLFYKLEHGYLDYRRKAAVQKPFRIDDQGRDFIYMRALWYDVIRKYHQAQ